MSLMACCSSWGANIMAQSSAFLEIFKRAVLHQDVALLGAELQRFTPIQAILRQMRRNCAWVHNPEHTRVKKQVTRCGWQSRNENKLLSTQDTWIRGNQAIWADNTRPLMPDVVSNNIIITRARRASSPNQTDGSRPTCASMLPGDRNM